MIGPSLVGIFFVPFALTMWLMDYLLYPILSLIFFGVFETFNGDAASASAWFLYIMGFVPIYCGMAFGFYKIATN